MTKLKKWVLLLVCLSVLIGCGRIRPPHTPPVMASLPPSGVERLPEITEKSSAVEIPADIQRIHAQLFQDAQRQFDAGEYSQAISGLKRLLALQSESLLETESRWLLAQAYDRVGEWEAARDHYRLLADLEGHRYGTEAKLKLHELKVLLDKFRLPPQDTQAIRLTLEQLPASGGFDEGIKKMKEDGITTLLIDLGCGRHGFTGSKMEEAPVALQRFNLQEILHSYIERSHRLHLLVYVGVNLRCAGHWHGSPLPEWRDRSYNVKTQRFEMNRFFDIFHPEYQQFLQRFLAGLSEEHVDGLVFLDDYPLGIYDGISPAGLSRFHHAFGIDFDPVKVFQPGFDPLGSLKAPQNVTEIPQGSDENSAFWRWAGWKARERLTVFEQLIDHLRKRHLTVQCGLELHPHGLTDPLRALVEYAQDAMEATRRPFSFFFVRPEIDRRSTFDQQAVIEKLRNISTKAVLTRLLPVLDDPRRVWVSRPAERGTRIAPAAAENDSSIFQNFPSGIGVVHDLRAFS